MPTELLYRIIDEPKESPWRAWVVKPFWPWLALLLGGVWAGAPWFIVNALAIGSHSRRKEIALAAALPFALLGSLFAAFALGDALELPRRAVPYLILPAVFLKLALAYVLFVWQSRAFELHRHFGGVAKSGAFVAVAAFLLRSRVLEAVPTWLALGLM